MARRKKTIAQIEQPAESASADTDDLRPALAADEEHAPDAALGPVVIDGEAFFAGDDHLNELRAAVGAPPARARRLERAGCPLLWCPVLGIELDVGPRSDARARPTCVDGTWMSAAGAAIVEARLSSDDLEHAAGWLRGRVA